MEGRGFRQIWESMGVGAIFQDIRIPKTGFLGMLNWERGGGPDDIFMGDLVEVVSGDLLGIGDESGEARQFQMVKCKGKSERIREEGGILTALDFTGELIAKQCRLKSMSDASAGTSPDCKKIANWI